MAHAYIALRTIDKHCEPVWSNSRFNVLDCESRKITGYEQIIRTQDCWVTGIVDKNRSRISFNINDLNYSHLFIDGLLITGPPIHAHAFYMPEANPNACRKT